MAEVAGLGHSTLMEVLKKGIPIASFLKISIANTSRILWLRTRKEGIMLFYSGTDDEQICLTIGPVGDTCVRVGF